MVAKADIDRDFAPEGLQGPFEIGILHQVTIIGGVGAGGDITLCLHEYGLVHDCCSHNSPCRLEIRTAKIPFSSACGSAVSAGKSKGEGASAAFFRSSLKMAGLLSVAIGYRIRIICSRLQAFYHQFMMFTGSFLGKDLIADGNGRLYRRL